MIEIQDKTLKTVIECFATIGYKDTIVIIAEAMGQVADTWSEFPNTKTQWQILANRMKDFNQW